MWRGEEGKGRDGTGRTSEPDVRDYDALYEVGDGLSRAEEVLVVADPDRCRDETEGL